MRPRGEKCALGATFGRSWGEQKRVIAARNVRSGRLSRDLGAFSERTTIGFAAKHARSRTPWRSRSIPGNKKTFSLRKMNAPGVLGAKNERAKRSRCEHLRARGVPGAKQNVRGAFSGRKNAFSSRTMHKSMLSGRSRGERSVRSGRSRGEKKCVRGAKNIRSRGVPGAFPVGFRGENCAHEGFRSRAEKMRAWGALEVFSGLYVCLYNIFENF